MHTHSCRYCDRDFVCRSVLECYDRDPLVCRDCFWRHDVVSFIICALIGLVLISLSFYLFGGR